MLSERDLSHSGHRLGAGSAMRAQFAPGRRNCAKLCRPRSAQREAVAARAPGADRAIARASRGGLQCGPESVKSAQGDRSMTAFGVRAAFRRGRRLDRGPGRARLAARAAGAGAQRRAPQSCSSCIDCRKLTDAAQRLACYDQAAGGPRPGRGQGRHRGGQPRTGPQGPPPGLRLHPALDVALRARREARGDRLHRGQDRQRPQARRPATGRSSSRTAPRWVQIDLTEIPLDPKPGQTVKIKAAAGQLHDGRSTTSAR